METQSARNHLILEAIDESLDKMGAQAKITIYWHLKERYSLRKEEIPMKSLEFIQAIRTLLGAGSWVLEKSMIRSLKNKSTTQDLPDDFFEAVSLLNEPSG